MKNFNAKIKLLLVIDSYYLLAVAMIGPIYALFVDKVGGSLMDASFAFFVYSMASGITSLISGRYADKTKHPEKILALGRLMVALGYVFFMFVSNTTQLFLAQIIIGMGVAIASPAYDGIFTVAADRHKESTEWGVWESMFFFASAIGAVIGGLIVTKFGFDVMFIVMAMLITATVPLALSLNKTPK